MNRFQLMCTAAFALCGSIYAAEEQPLDTTKETKIIPQPSKEMLTVQSKDSVDQLEDELDDEEDLADADDDEDDQ